MSLKIIASTSLAKLMMYKLVVSLSESQ